MRSTNLEVIRQHITGYVPDLINLLQSKMEFIPKLILKPSNMTYVQCVSKQCQMAEYDMLIGDVTITAARREIADFSSAISDDALRIMVRKKSDVSVDLLSFLKPFTPQLWLLILAASVYSTILIFLFEREENDCFER